MQGDRQTSNDTGGVTGLSDGITTDQPVTLQWKRHRELDTVPIWLMYSVWRTEIVAMTRLHYLGGKWKKRQTGNEFITTPYPNERLTSTNESYCSEITCTVKMFSRQKKTGCKFLLPLTL